MKAFDPIRKQYVELTPEEQVRQYCIRTLIDLYHYPKGAIAVEGRVVVNSMPRRFDILVYDRHLKPFMLVECKRKEVTLTQKTIDQIAAYNHAIGAPYLMITNAVSTYVMQKTDSGYRFCDAVPDYPL